MDQITPAEAQFVLERLIMREQERLRRLLRPYLAELTQVSFRNPPAPFVMPDGRVMKYVGPTADELGGTYRAPRWLNDLLMEDPEMMRDLREIREGG